MATDHGQFDIFRWIIATSYNLNCVTYGFYSLAYLASKAGFSQQFLLFMNVAAEKSVNYEVIRYITGHCNRSTKSDDYISLFIACLDGNLNGVAKYFIVDRKTDILPKDMNDWNLLHLTCLTGNLDIVLYITKLKAGSVHHNDIQGNSPLHLACVNGNVEIIKHLILVMGDNICPVNFYDQTALHVACLHGNLEAVKVLSSSVTDSITWSDNKGYRPLHLACKVGNLDIVKYLTKTDKCDTFFSDNRGFLPLHVACMFGHSCIVKYMITELPQDKYGKNYIHTALSLACDKGCLKSVQVLLEESVVMRDNFSWKFLSQSYDMGHENIVNYFVDNIPEDEFGCTAFYYACDIGHKGLIFYLMDHYKVDLHTRNNEGKTSIDLLCCKDDLDTIKYIVKYDEYRSVVY